MDNAEASEPRRARSRRRKGRRHHHHGSRSSEGRPRPTEPLRAWLDVLDGVLRAVEETAWQVREATDMTRELLETGREALDDLRGRGDGLGLERRGLGMPHKIARLSTTAWVLTQLTASYRLLPTREAFMPEASGRRMRQNVHTKNAERVRDLCEKQGGALLKVGQMLSSRPDLLPAIWCETLQTLQDDCPPITFEAARQVVESELGAPLETHFASFDPEPVASASIGQVHKATLPDGREVAVKVQRPGIEQLVELDLEILELFIDASRDALPPLDLDTIVSEVQAMITAELDYRREADTTDRVATMFEGHAQIRVPRTVREVSTQRVLVTEWMPGEKISRVLQRWHGEQLAGEADGADKIGQALGLVMQAYFVQILEHGLFQADPHPGNLLLGEDGTLVLLDFGCAKAVDDPERLAYLALVQAFFLHDHARIAELLAQVGLRTQSGQVDSLERFTTTILSEFDAAREKGGWPAQAQVLASAAAFLGDLHDDPIVNLPQDFVMLGRVFATLGGLFMEYQPRIQFARDILPVMQRLAEAAQAGAKA